jgi:hypothetical protein
MEVQHEDFMDAILEVQSKKKMNLNYYAWCYQIFSFFIVNLIHASVFYYF